MEITTLLWTPVPVFKLKPMFLNSGLKSLSMYEMRISNMERLFLLLFCQGRDWTLETEFLVGTKTFISAVSTTSYPAAMHQVQLVSSVPTHWVVAGSNGISSSPLSSGLHLLNLPSTQSCPLGTLQPPPAAQWWCQSSSTAAIPFLDRYPEMGIMLRCSPKATKHKTIRHFTPFFK